jgi:hypothetical protein
MYSGISVKLSGGSQRSFLSAGGVAGACSQDYKCWEAYVNRQYTTLDGLTRYYSWGFAGLRRDGVVSIALDGLKGEAGCNVLCMFDAGRSGYDTVKGYLWVDRFFRLRAGRAAPSADPSADTVDTSGVVIAQL